MHIASSHLIVHFESKLTFLLLLLASALLGPVDLCLRHFCPSRSKMYEWMYITLNVINLKFF